MNEIYSLSKIKTNSGLEIIKEYNSDCGYYDIVIKEGDNIIYYNMLTETKLKIYDEFIKFRLDLLLQNHGKLQNPFNMFELGRRMYRVCDWENRDHRKLVVDCEPIDYDVEEPIRIDLLLDSTLYDLFTYKPNTLVYRFNHFYLNGIDLGHYLEVIHSLGFKTTDINVDFGTNVDKLAMSISRIVGYDIIGFVGEGCDCVFEKKKKTNDLFINEGLIAIESMIKKELTEKIASDLESNICGDQKGTITINSGTAPLSGLDMKELTKIISENLKGNNFRLYGTSPKEENKKPRK